MSYNDTNWDEQNGKISGGNLNQELPYVTLEAEAIVTLKDGSICGAIEFFPPHIDMWSNQNLNTLQKNLCNVVNSLEPGISLQWELYSSTDITRITEKHFKPFTKEVLKDDLEMFEIERTFRLKWYEEQAKNGQLRHWRHFVFINYKAPQGDWQDPKKIISNTFHDLKKLLKSKVIIQESYEAFQTRAKKLVNSVQNLQSNLSAFGWNPKIVQVTDWCDYLYQIFNPTKYLLGLPAHYPTDNNRDFNSCFLFSDIKEPEIGGGFILDGYHHKIITLPEIKGGASILGLMRGITRANIANMRLTVIGQGCDADHYLLEIRRDIKGLRYKLGKEPDNEGYAQQIRDRIQEQREILQGNQKIFESRIVLHLWHKNPDVLEKIISKLSIIGQEMGNVRWYEEGHNAVPYFLSTLPGWTNDKDDNRLNEFKTKNFVDLIPICGQFNPSNCTHTNPDPDAQVLEAPILLENSEMGLCGFNPLDKNGINLNGIVLGRIRTGKSVSNVFLNTGLLPLNARLICIDLNESSRTLIEARNGVYYTISADSTGTTQRINPFGGLNVTHVPTDDEIIDVASVIECMVLTENLTDSNEHRVLVNTLREAIRRTFQTRPGREVFVKDLYSTLAGMSSAEAHTICTLLSEWCNQGTLARYVDGPTTANLNSPAIGFELQGIQKQKELLPVIISLIASVASRLANDYQGIPKIIVIDEFAILGKNPILARYVELMYRTYGKTGTGIWTISQEINDYDLCSSGNSESNPVINNTGQMIFFAQNESAIPDIAKKLDLPASALQQIASNQTLKGHYAEAFLYIKQQIGEPHMGKVLFRSNPIMYWLFTSSPNDRAVRKSYITRFKKTESSHQRAVQRAIITLAEEMPTGIDNTNRELTPRISHEMEQEQPQDSAPWQPFNCEIAKLCGYQIKPDSKKMAASLKN
jgi:type IV secretory pathway VirB4 component